MTELTPPAPSKTQMLLSAIEHRAATRQHPISESGLVAYAAITEPALTTAQVAEILDGWERDGFITTFYDPDQQQRVFMTTDAGRAALKRMRADANG